MFSVDVVNSSDVEEYAALNASANTSIVRLLQTLDGRHDLPANETWNMGAPVGENENWTVLNCGHMLSQSCFFCHVQIKSSVWFSSEQYLK